MYSSTVDGDRANVKAFAPVFTDEQHKIYIYGSIINGKEE
jgi:hypothetical protein